MASNKVTTKVKLYASTYDVKRDKAPFRVITIDSHKTSEKEAILKDAPFMIDGCIKVERCLK